MFLLISKYKKLYLNLDINLRKEIKLKKFKKKLKVKLVNPNPTGNISEHESSFRAAIDVLNRKKSTSNQKLVSIAKVEEDQIIIIVESEKDLVVPGRAFSGFSRFLINNSDNNFFRDNVFHDKLLCFQEIDEYDVEVKLSNEEVLYKLAYLLTKPNKKLSVKERYLIQNISVIAEKIEPI